MACEELCFDGFDLLPAALDLQCYVHSVNLLRETIDALEENSHTSADVRWVGDTKYWITWEQFASLADFDYDDGFGGVQIREELLIVGDDDWWLERHEYDGSEWWEFKRLPARGEPAELFSVRTTIHQGRLGTFI